MLMLQKQNWTFWTAMHLPLHPQWTIRSLTKLKVHHTFLVTPGAQILLTYRTVNYRLPIDARLVGPQLRTIREVPMQPTWERFTIVFLQTSELVS